MKAADLPRLTDDAVEALAARAVALATEVARAMATGTLGRLSEHRAGPGGGGNGHGRAGVAYSDPTAAAALRGAGDVAGRHRAELEAKLVRAVAALRQVRELCEAYPEPAVPARHLEADEPGCQSCARAPGPGGRRWEPPDRRLAGPTDVAGRLAVPAYLCVWCHEKVRAWGRLPTVAEVTAHHEGRRVRWPADVPQPRRAR